MKTPKSILLVEDNKHDQFFFIEALSEIENVTIYDVANNGKEALDKLKKSTVLPDIIFTDINMPVMGGIECLTKIIKTPVIKNIPVVILSTDITKIELVRKLGAKAFIKKPCEYKILKEQLEIVINLDFITDIHLANQTFQTALSAF
ncbi:MAG: response regulator [Fimbriimonadaceae bacterium]|nr:response regulator [Chitinophagales bacterium]